MACKKNNLQPQEVTAKIQSVCVTLSQFASEAEGYNKMHQLPFILIYMLQFYATGHLGISTPTFFVNMSKHFMQV